MPLFLEPQRLVNLNHASLINAPQLQKNTELLTEYLYKIQSDPGTSPYHLVSLITRWLQMWTWLVHVTTSARLIVANERIGVLLLVEVAQRVVDATVDGLVCTDVQYEVSHRPLPLGHVPVGDGQLGDLEFGV